MKVGVIAQKIGMTSLFEGNNRLPVTLLKVLPCSILDVKAKNVCGYDALVLGCKDQKESRVSKPIQGFFKKLNLRLQQKVQGDDISTNQISLKSIIREFRFDGDSPYKVGDVIDSSHYSIGDVIDVSGNSIGKGFAGVMKRHNFPGLSASHGVSLKHRSGGSTGGCQDPGRVFKNTKMAGHMGNTKVTVQNLLIKDVYEDLLIIKGAVPGPKGSFLRVTSAKKKFGGYQC
jgi:large subunit ribosomal protein L3